MYRSQINAMYIKHESLDRIYQGDILRDLPAISWSYVDGQYKVVQFELPYAVVMTQDCDLDNDYKNRQQIMNLESNNNAENQKKNNPPKKKHDKYLPSILICPAYLAESLKEGKHLEDFNQVMERWDSKRFDSIKKQNKDRFHYLESNPIMQIADLIIDFKHYYTIPRDVLYHMYSDKYLASLNQLFREYLSQRFFNYFSRIGLPDLSACESNESTKS